MNEPKLSDAKAPKTRRWKRFLVWATISKDPNAPEAEPLRAEMAPLELANLVRSQFYKDRNHIRIKRRRWSAGAILIRLVALGLSGAATILLGLSELSGPAAWGFAGMLGEERFFFVAGSAPTPSLGGLRPPDPL